MINVTETQYLNWQHRLSHNRRFRLWWQFWSNYSWVLLLPVLIWSLWFGHNVLIIVQITTAFVLVRFFVVSIFTRIYPSPRPYQLYGFAPITSIFLSTATKQERSFPSRHVISLIAVGSSIILLSPISATIFLLVALKTGLGRVVLGYHFPKDIVFGVIFGLIGGLLVAFLF